MHYLLYLLIFRVLFVPSAYIRVSCVNFADLGVSFALPAFLRVSFVISVDLPGLIGAIYLYSGCHLLYLLIFRILVVISAYLPGLIYFMCLSYGSYLFSLLTLRDSLIISANLAGLICSLC